MYVKHADPVRSVIYVLWLTTLIAIHHDAKVGIKYCGDGLILVVMLENVFHLFISACMYTLINYTLKLVIFMIADLVNTKMSNCTLILSNSTVTNHQ